MSTSTRNRAYYQSHKQDYRDRYESRRYGSPTQREGDTIYFLSEREYVSDKTKMIEQFCKAVVRREYGDVQIDKTWLKNRVYLADNAGHIQLILFRKHKTYDMNGDVYWKSKKIATFEWWKDM